MYYKSYYTVAVFYLKIQEFTFFMLDIKLLDCHIKNIVKKMNNLKRHL